MILPPTHAAWESTLKCPLRCKHCGLDAGLARPQELETTEAQEMLSDLSNFGISNLIISGGEFTSRHDWLKLLEFSLSHFPSVRIITCGWLGKDLFAEINPLKNTSRLTISVSLDGLKENHDHRRGKGSFDEVMETLTYPSPIPKTVLTTIDRRNIYDCPDILRLCLELNIPLWSLQISLPAGRMKPELFLGPDNVRKLSSEIMHWQETFGERIIISPDDCFAHLFPQRHWGEWTGCHAGKRLITILNSGLVTGCPTFRSRPAGDIRTASIQEIWQSPKMEMIRQEKPQGCKECGACPGGCKAVNSLFENQFCFINPINQKKE